MRHTRCLTVCSLTLVALMGCEAMGPVFSPPSTGGTDPGKRPTRPPAAASGGKPQIVLSNAEGKPGQALTLTATLRTGGASIAGTQNDIGYDPKQVAVVPTQRNKPDCAANRSLGKEGTAFSYQPSGCKNGNCGGVRALVLSLSNVDPIPNGSTLYTCKMQIRPQATPGAQRLTISRVAFSDPKGNAIEGSGTNGNVRITK
jgi:hypothetical protein